MTRVWARVKKIWVTLGITTTVVFVGWSLIAFRASSEAREAAKSDANVAVARRDGVWRFTATRATAASTIGLLFFPGALVDPTAYAPLARAVAASGFPVIIVELPRRGAFGGANDAELPGRTMDQMRQAGGPQRWVIAGHSRGAVVASAFVAQPRDGVAGLVLLGTTHPRDVDLSTLVVPVTKVMGTRDRIAPMRQSDANRHLLPATTRWVRIEGGNHSQFGWYGFQPGDGFAEVARDAQHAQVLAAILDMLRMLDVTTPRGEARIF